jgi:hypothetical protein
MSEFGGTVGGYAAVGGGVIAVLGFVRLFIWQQISDLRTDVDHLEAKLSELEHLYDQERGLKHKAFNDVARASMALEMVRRLAAQCTCGVLEPLVEIVNRMTVEFESMRHRNRDELAAED